MSRVSPSEIAPLDADARAEEGRIRWSGVESPDDRGVCFVRPDVDVESRGPDDGGVCFVCLDASHDDGSPLLVRVCACTSLGVHQACLQAFLNSEARRALSPSERRRCPICAQPYTAPIVSISGPKPDRQPYTWSEVRTPGIAFGLGLVLLGLGTALIITMEHNFEAVFFGIIASTTGTLALIWMLCAHLADQDRQDRLDQTNWVFVGAPPISSTRHQDAASANEAAAARHSLHAAEASLELAGIGGTDDEGERQLAQPP
jgi:hypothetical protein